MSVSTTIKKQIITKIENCNSVKATYGYENVNPSGFPAIFVTAGDLEGEFASNSENSRVYSYRIFMIFPIGQDFPVSTNMNRLQYAEEVLATVIDEIIDAVDTDFELDGSPVLYVNAANGSWGYSPYEGGEARSAELTLKVYTEKTVV